MKTNPSTLLRISGERSRSTKVLIVSHAYVVELNQQKVEALAENKDFDITLLTPTTWKAPLRDTALEKTSDPNYLIKSFAPIASGNNDRYFFSPLKVFKLLRDFKPDIIHVEEEPWSLVLLEFMIIGKLFGAKIIFFSWENLFRKHRPWYLLIEKINLKLADYAITGNSEAKEIILKKGFTKKVVILPQLGVDPKVFTKNPDFELKKKLGLNNFVIGCFARMEEQKGIRTILEAFRNLPEKNISLLLVGSGPLLAEFQQLSSSDPRIVAPGVINHSQMPQYFSLLDIFVLASQTTPVWKEQFGHVLIEAMAMGIPTVGSDSGAIPEVIGDGGLIFQEGDARDLEKKLKELLSDKKLYQKLSVAGKKRVDEHYTQKIIAQETWKIYQSLLKK